MLNIIKQFFTKGKLTGPNVMDEPGYIYFKNESFVKLISKLNNYFSAFPESASRFKDELDYLNKELGSFTEEKKLLYAIMPYPFAKKYEDKAIEVFKDDDAGMFYVLLEGKKLYYPRTYTDAVEVRTSFRYLMIEQDAESPHRYLDEDFILSEDDIVLDLGAAEGNFSLLVVDKVKQLIIVEGDVKWLEAIEKTFEPWKNKVQIINKFVGGVINDANYVTIGNIPGIEKVTAIKMDIEGSEWEILTSAGSLLHQENLKLAITTYHKSEDEKNFKDFLESNNFHTVFSKNYLLFIYDDLKPPYFRKGVIKATKIKTPLEQ